MCHVAAVCKLLKEIYVSELRLYGEFRFGVPFYSKY